MVSHPHTADRGTRVLVVDDSVVARTVIARLIDASGRFVVAGAVATVAAAFEFLARTRVDIVLLDIAMPGVDGLTALPDLIAAAAGAQVVVVSSSASDGAAATVSALALGAADTVVKPAASGMSGRFGPDLLDKLDRLATGSPAAAAAKPPPASPAGADDFDIVAVGASTGGIHALGGLLRALPPAFRLPILVTQHLPASFMPYFAAQLAVLSGRPCDVATDRMRIRPGRVVVAPGDAHVRCVRIGPAEAAIRLSSEPVASGCLPSVDPMLGSVASIFGARSLAVILSGMGRDGAEGARRIHDAGGAVVIQDQATSVVWGMPSAVAAQGIADAILPPDAIGRLVAARRRP